MTVTVIANPVAGLFSRRRLRAACATWEQAGFAVRVRESRYRGHCEELARDAAQDSDIVVAAGGDGTTGEVINALAYTGVPMGILPFGTVNVLPLELGIPQRLAGAAATIRDGRTTTIHLGRAGNRYFSLMAGIGFDAEVVHGVDDRRKARWGKYAYLLSMGRVLRHFSPAALSIQAESQTLTAGNVVVCNSRLYGGPFVMAPDAGVTRAGLYVMTFQGRRRLDMLRYGIALLLRRQLRLSDVTCQKVDRVTICSTARQEAKVQLDGDPDGVTPLQIELAEDALAVIVPEKRGC